MSKNALNAIKSGNGCESAAKTEHESTIDTLRKELDILRHKRQIENELFENIKKQRDDLKEKLNEMDSVFLKENFLKIKKQN